MLPAIDSSYLTELGGGHSIASEANMTCIILSRFPLPEGFDRRESDLLLRLSAGYPDVPPDMWWFDPPVKRANGQVIKATEVVERHLGRSWQRWSRHFQSGQWRSGIDGLRNFLALLRKELERSAVGDN